MRAIIVPGAIALAMAWPAYAQDELEPAAAGTAESAEAPAPVTDAATFATTVISAGAFEIKSSEIMVQRTSNPSVAEFAEAMIVDHTHAGEQLETVLGAREDPIIDVEETGLDTAHAELLTQLERAADEDVDVLYISMQVTAHEEAVALFEGYAENGDDDALRAFAEETLPVLREHLDMIKLIAASLG